MNDPTFCGGFGNIALVGGMVRLEIVVLSPTKKTRTAASSANIWVRS